ncbi:SMP-30/gluconolactonase/LRE family protein [Deinococcus altitudinis]|uniref:Vgb family protein n=1 Tax=Deinococcus altitudinis TaxID=468914 RepID=UPI003892493E
MPTKRFLPLLATLLLAACNQPQASLGTAPASSFPGADQPAPPQVVARQVYEVRFQNIGAPAATSSISAVGGGVTPQTLKDIDDSKLVFTPVTVDTFVVGGKRYIRAIYDVKNNTGAALQHLTFVPIDTDPNPAATAPTTTAPTVGSSYFKSLQRFDGSDTSSRAGDLTPITGRVYSTAAHQDVTDPDATPYAALDTSTLNPVAPAGLIVAGRANSGWRSSVSLANGSSTSITFAVAIANSSAQTDPFNFSLVVAEGDDVLPPSVTGISPNLGLTAGGTVVTVTGTGFTSGTAVKFGNVPASSVTVNSSTSLTATSPASNTTGNADVTVSNSTGSSSVGPADQFDYLAFAEFVVPSAGSFPTGIVGGPDGNLWFTEQTGNKIGRVTPIGTFREFNVPTPDSFPYGVTSGPDGNLWFAQSNGNKIGRVTPTGTVTEFALPTPDSSPTSITRGPDGNLWFTEYNANKIGRVTPGGTVTEFAVPTAGSTPSGIASGPDGNLWFTDSTGNTIGRITPAGLVTVYSIPTAGSMPQGIVRGPDGNLWFAESTGNKIGRITPAGVLTEFVVPTADSQPQDIASGADGNLWFTESAGNKIGRITPAGSIAEFVIPTSGSGAQGITSGPDGNLWFTESTGNKIGVLKR